MNRSFLMAISGLVGLSTVAACDLASNNNGAFVNPQVKAPIPTSWTLDYPLTIQGQKALRDDLLASKEQAFDELAKRYLFGIINPELEKVMGDLFLKRIQFTDFKKFGYSYTYIAACARRIPSVKSRFDMGVIFQHISAKTDEGLFEKRCVYEILPLLIKQTSKEPSDFKSTSPFAPTLYEYALNKREENFTTSLEAFTKSWKLGFVPAASKMIEIKLVLATESTAAKKATDIGWKESLSLMKEAGYQLLPETLLLIGVFCKNLQVSDPLPYWGQAAELGSSQAAAFLSDHYYQVFISFKESHLDDLLRSFLWALKTGKLKHTEKPHPLSLFFEKKESLTQFSFGSQDVNEINLFKDHIPVLTDLFEKHSDLARLNQEAKKILSPLLRLEYNTILLFEKIATPPVGFALTDVHPIPPLQEAIKRGSGQLETVQLLQLPTRMDSEHDNIPSSSSLPSSGLLDVFYLQETFPKNRTLLSIGYEAVHLARLFRQVRKQLNQAILLLPDIYKNLHDTMASLPIKILLNQTQKTKTELILKNCSSFLEPILFNPFWLEERHRQFSLAFFPQKKPS